MPGLEPGLLLYRTYSDSWAKIIYENNEFGVQWLHNNLITFGIKTLGLDVFDFYSEWRIAGAGNCPSVPGKYNYEPPSNQGRKYCFWHPNIKTKTKHIKSLGAVFIYCSKCKR
jgi:hypothetical protein